MDDIFYLNQRKISIEEIYNFLKNNHSEIKMSLYNDTFSVELDSAVHFYYTQMKLDEFQEPDDKKFLADEKIQSIIMITHHPRDLKSILPFIREYMEKSDGLIGNDSDAFQPIYNIYDLSSFNYDL